MRKVIFVLIDFYQKYLSFDRGVLAVFAPGGACRYDPGCSEYTKQMINKYGVLDGIKMGAKRVWSCR